MMRLFCALVLLFLVSDSSGQDSERSTRIVENLKEQVTSLAGVEINVLHISESRYDGLDEGALVLQMQNGPVQIGFLLSKDDSQLFLINGQPLDVREDPSIRRNQRASLIAAAAKGRPVKGPIGSGNVIAEFSDFQCPYCAKAVVTIRQVVFQQPSVAVAFFHLPLENIHPWARAAAIASECAFDQGNDTFWTLHDGLFKYQADIDSDNLIDIASGILQPSGADIVRWKACATGEDEVAFTAASTRVETDILLATQLGVQSTPTYFANGYRFSGGVTAATLIGSLR